MRLPLAVRDHVTNCRVRAGMSRRAANWLLITILVLVLVVALMFARTGIVPEVVSCVPQHEPARHTGPNWQPTLRVNVEPARDQGRVREYRMLGCSLYYYHAHFK